MLRLRNSIMDGIRKCGLHPSQVETQTDDQGMVDTTSFRDTLITSSGNQTVAPQRYRVEITGYDPGYDPGYVTDDVSISSGSLSPDLREMWG